MNGDAVNGHETSYPKPLNSSGALEKFEYEDVTPCIGREFPGLNILDDLLNSPDSDALIRDLAINSTSVSTTHSSVETHSSLSLATVCSILSQPKQPHGRATEAAGRSSW